MYSPILLVRKFLVFPFVNRNDTIFSRTLFLILSQWTPKGWVPKPLALLTSITSTRDIWCSHVTTLLSFTFHVDVDGQFTCPIEAKIKEFIFVQTSVAMKAIPRPLQFQGATRDIAPLKLSNIQAHTSIEVFLSIPKSSLHDLRVAHSLTLMTPSLRGWEAFPTHVALTHTMIIWAFPPTAPQVSGVIPGSSLCPWGTMYPHILLVLGIPYGEMRDILRNTINTNVPKRVSFKRRMNL